MPPWNLPIPGAPMPLSLLTSPPFFDFFTFSRMMPFSFASCLLVASFFVAFDTMPLRWDIGIFSCASTDDLEPRF